MNKYRFITSLIITFLTFGTVNAQKSGRTYRVNVNDFSELRIDNSIPVNYICNADSAGIAVIEDPDDIVDLIIFDNNGRGRLSIQRDADHLEVNQLPTVTVYSSTLFKVVNNGDSLVRVNNLPVLEKFKASVIGNGRLSVHDLQATKVEGSIDSGNGQLILSGKCTEASLRNIGTGTIQADNLQAVKVKAKIVGTGTIGCNPTESLSISGMGSGNVLYRQKPPTFKNRGMGLHHSTL